MTFSSFEKSWNERKKKNIALSLNKWWNSFKGLWHRNWCIYTFFAVANWKFLKLKWPCSLKIATEHNWTMHCNFPLVWNDIVLFLLGHDDHSLARQQQLLCTHAVIVIDNNDEFQLKPLVKNIHDFFLKWVGEVALSLSHNS